MLEAEGAKVVIADLPETDVTDEAAVRALSSRATSCTARSTAPGSAAGRA